MQRQVAFGERGYVLTGEQAVPVLIRVRELEALGSREPPRSRQLVALATGSQHFAALMPEGWIDRLLAAGRMLLLIDGLDETDPATRDTVLFPWLIALLQAHQGIDVVITSRPAGFPVEAFGTSRGGFSSWHPALYTLHEFDRGEVLGTFGIGVLRSGSRGTSQRTRPPGRVNKMRSRSP